MLGLFAGIGLAPLLAGLLGLIGFDLPSTALVVARAHDRRRDRPGHRRDAAVEPGARRCGPRASRPWPRCARARLGSSRAKRRWALALQVGVAGLGLVAHARRAVRRPGHVAGADAAGRRGGARLRRRRPALAAARRPAGGADRAAAGGDGRRGGARSRAATPCARPAGRPARPRR